MVKTIWGVAGRSLNWGIKGPKGHKLFPNFPFFLSLNTFFTLIFNHAVVVFTLIFNHIMVVFTLIFNHINIIRMQPNFAVIADFKL
jgi:hypothetical protein